MYIVTLHFSGSFEIVRFLEYLVFWIDEVEKELLKNVRKKVKWDRFNKNFFTYVKVFHKKWPSINYLARPRSCFTTPNDILEHFLKMSQTL